MAKIVNHIKITDVKNSLGVNTKDKVYILSSDEVKDLPAELKINYGTDFTVASGAMMDRVKGSERNAGFTWSRSSDNVYKANVLYPVGGSGTDVCVSGKHFVRPALNLSIDVKDFKNLKIEKEDEFYVIELGNFPQWHVSKSYKYELEDKYFERKLKDSGKCYLQDLNYEGNYKEFEYRGKKYVRVLARKHDGYSIYANRDVIPCQNIPTWFEVSPIKWYVMNYEDLQKDVDNETYTLNLLSKECLFASCFYPNVSDVNSNLWQNSTLRGYLNGICVNNLETRPAPRGGNFGQFGGFLEEAFGDLELFKVKNNKQIEPQNVSVNKIIVAKKITKQTENKELQAEKIVLDVVKRKITELEEQKSNISFISNFIEYCKIEKNKVKLNIAKEMIENIMEEEKEVESKTSQKYM